jgi:hypothetical protein
MKRTVDVTRAPRLNLPSSAGARLFKEVFRWLLFFGLICFGVIRFLCVVGTDRIRTGAPAIDKGRFSDNRSLHLSRNMP